jgi:hypothetical protein
MGFNRVTYPEIRVLRWGFAYDHNPRAIAPEPFAYLAGEAPETWGQEVVVYHNPRARHPITDDFFEDAAQYRLDRQGLHCVAADFHPLMSMTMNLVGRPESMPEIEERLRNQGRAWTLRVHEQRTSMEEAIAEEHKRWPAAED